MLTLSIYQLKNIDGIDSVFLRTTAQAAIIHSQASDNLEYNLNHLIDSVDITCFDNNKSKTISLLRNLFTTMTKRDSRQIIHEFIRQIYCKKDGLDLMDAVRFVKSLKKFKESAYRNLARVIKDRGDDSLGDLIDSLVLASDDVIYKVNFGHYREGDYNIFVEDIRKGSGEILSEIILEGENYIEMFTTEKIKEFFAGWVKHQVEDYH